MSEAVVRLDIPQWQAEEADPQWTQWLEAGKVLLLPRLGFELHEAERPLLREEMLTPKARNVSLNEAGELRGAAGTEAERTLLATMVGRFRRQALELVETMFPAYAGLLRVAPTSFRPRRVQLRRQSVRADDRRMHVDAFPTRPNRGERILRVFVNINPNGEPRTWRVGGSFESVAQQFLPRAKPYSRWQARLLNTLGATKSFRSEYDHLMLQLHDGMKHDDDYQQNGEQLALAIPAGSTWICYSDQAVHAAMDGQFMMEQTLHLPVGREANPDSSPLTILTRLTGRQLV